MYWMDFASVVNLFSDFLKWFISPCFAASVLPVPVTLECYTRAVMDTWIPVHHDTKLLDIPATQPQLMAMAQLEAQLSL